MNLLELELKLAKLRKQGLVNDHTEILVGFDSEDSGYERLEKVDVFENHTLGGISISIYLDGYVR